jgi:peptidoglycan/LPS O-acetylase OafA/YrhL
LSVVVHHWVVAQGPETYARSTHSALRFLVLGNEAVMLFFVLSGFVLALPYERREGSNYGGFLVKRICRIYLPYLGALALAVTMNSFYYGLVTKVPWIAQTWHQKPSFGLVMQHVLFLGSYNWEAFNSAFWSLIYEMRISLVFPLIAIAVFRFRAAWILLFALLLSLSANPLSTAICSLFGLDTGSAAVVRTAETQHYMAFFILGAVLARYREVTRERFLRLPAIAVAGLSVLAVVLYCHPYHSYFIGTPYLFELQVEQWSVALGGALLIVLALNSARLQRFLHNPAVRYLGKISYSLYLVHVTVLFTLIYMFHGVLNLKVLPIYLAASFCVASVFWYLVERPSMWLGQRLGTRLRGAGRSSSRSLQPTPASEIGVPKGRMPAAAISEKAM